jgi:hypothetical protein
VRRNSSIGMASSSRQDLSEAIASLRLSILYAAECRPVPTSTIRWLRQHSCKAAGLAGLGIAHRWVWALRNPREDPAYLAWEKTVLRWCREVWFAAHPEAAVSHGDRVGPETVGRALSHTLARIEQALEDRPDWNGNNKDLPDGPTAAYVPALAVVGWTHLNWHEIELHYGSVGDLQCTSQARLKALYRARWEKVQWDDAIFKRLLEYSEHWKDGYLTRLRSGGPSAGKAKRPSLSGPRGALSECWPVHGRTAPTSTSTSGAN